MHWYALIFIQLVAIYVTSRMGMVRIFQAVRSVTKSTSVSVYALTVLYLPGIVIHEVSHLLTSIVLFVPAYGMHLIPKVTRQEDGSHHIVFGSVHHHATDPIRGAVIASSPLLFGIGTCVAIMSSGIFPHQSFWVNIGIGYVLYTVAASMFSSKQDMKEAGPFLLGIAIVGCLILYVADAPVIELLSRPQAVSLVKQLNIYCAPLTAMHVVVAGVLGYRRS